MGEWIRRVVVAGIGAVVTGCGGAPSMLRTLPPVTSLAHGDHAIAFTPQVETFQLASGMVVALAPDRRTNLATVDLEYDIGAADDPAGRSGLAHLVEHMMFAVRPAAGQPTIGEQLDDLALDKNATTSWDATRYTATVAADQLGAVLDLEVKRQAFTCDAIDDDVLARERDVVLAEEAERAGPDVELALRLQAAIYGADHPYARPIGSSEIAGVGKDEVCAFIADHYAPAAARIVVSGRFDPAEVRAHLERSFGALPRRAVAPRAAIASPPLTGQTTRISAPVHHPTAIVVFAQPRPGASDAPAQAAARALLEVQLARADRDRSWIVGSDVIVLGGTRAPVMAAVVEVDRADQLEAAANEVFRRIADMRGRTTEVTHLQARLTADELAGWDDLLERGGWLADDLQLGGDRNMLADDLARVGDQWTDGGRVMLEALLPEHSHVIFATPQRGQVAARPRAVALGSHDLVPWRRAIDPADADRPLAVTEPAAPVAVEEFRLANGLDVMMAPDPASPIVDTRLVFPVGSAHEPPGQPQVATAAAMMLDDPDPRRLAPEGDEVYRWWVRGGERQDADVGEVATVFSDRGFAWWGDWHVWASWARLVGGAYDAATIAAVHDEVARQAAVGARLDDEDGPDRRFRERLFGRGHPYTTPPSTRWRALARLDRKQLEAWRDAHYRPRGATLVVSGAFEPDAMRKEIESLFGALADVAPAVPAPIPAAAPPPGPSWLAVADPDAIQVEVRLGFAAASDRVRDRAARLVLADMITDRMRDVREAQGASYGVESRYVGGVAGSALVIAGALHAAKAEAVVPRMLASIAALRDDEAERRTAFVAARRRVVARLEAQVAGASATADRLVAAAAAGEDLHAGPRLRAVAALTVADVERVIALDLDPARMVVDLRGAPATLDAVFAGLHVDPERMPAPREPTDDDGGDASEPAPQASESSAPSAPADRLSVGAGRHPDLWVGERQVSLDQFLRAAGEAPRADSIRSRRRLRIELALGGVALAAAGGGTLLSLDCTGQKEEFDACRDRQRGWYALGAGLVAIGAASTLIASLLDNHHPDADELREIADGARFQYQAARPSPRATVAATIVPGAIGLGVVGSF